MPAGGGGGGLKCILLIPNLQLQVCDENVTHFKTSDDEKHLKIPSLLIERAKLQFKPLIYEIN